MFFNLHVVENNQIIKLPEKTTPASQPSTSFLTRGDYMPAVIVATVGHWSVDITAGAELLR